MIIVAVIVVLLIGMLIMSARKDSADKPSFLICTACGSRKGTKTVTRGSIGIELLHGCASSFPASSIRSGDSPRAMRLAECVSQSNSFLFQLPPAARWRKSTASIPSPYSQHTRKIAMKPIWILCALTTSFTGCATIENGADHVRDFAVRHPVVTAVGTAVVVGGVVYALDHHHHRDPSRSPATCENNPSFPNGCHPIS